MSGRKIPIFNDFDDRPVTTDRFCWQFDCMEDVCDDICAEFYCRDGKVKSGKPLKMVKKDD